METGHSRARSDQVVTSLVLRHRPQSTPFFHDSFGLSSTQAVFPRAGPPILTCYPFPGRFVINLGQGSEKLNLHFNPRFRDSVIVCNSREGRWGQEQRVRGQGEVKGVRPRGGRGRESPEGRAPWPRHLLAPPEPP